MLEYNLIEVTPDNIGKTGVFCARNPKSEAYRTKRDWYVERYTDGLRMFIMNSQEDKPISFIEFVPGEYAWRPVAANEYVFIHCLYVYSKQDRERGIGSHMVEKAEQYAQSLCLNGVAVLASDGNWIANKRLFLRNNYVVCDKRGRFELLVKKFSEQIESPSIINWTENLQGLAGWHLFYADQCPWHEKSVKAIAETMRKRNIPLEIHRIESASAAQRSPSGYGVFAIVKDGELIEDHYISETRLLNILKKEEC
jgi:GNAT superfamily N-acetyltransferase